MERLRKYSLEIIRLITSGEISKRSQLNDVKISLCKRFNLKEMPSNATILSFARKKTDKLVAMLKVKPTRSLSGIAVVAIMSKAVDCPGKCIYCPSSLLPEAVTPKSYTGKEPATMRALSAGFDPAKQIKNRLEQLSEAGHSTEKVELIVMGGTFLAQPASYQKRFMVSSLNAVSGSKARSLKGARLAAEKGRTRLTGTTFETRPDFCSKGDISRMLSFGGTRCELGVQTIYDEAYKRVRRGHRVSHVVNATRLLKDSAFKVTYHYMPGLPGVSFAEDVKAMKLLFKDERFMPDGLKVYPCLVIEGTELFRQWKKGLYEPLSAERAAKLISMTKPFFPNWVRVMRIQRDIPSPLISAGVKKSNLRQLVQAEMHSSGKRCRCIRCREAGLLGHSLKGEPRLFMESYEASKGREFFISLEDRARERLFGFARLRLPFRPFREELLGDTALLRELRVFGLPLPLHGKSGQALQHRGLGKRLLREAEECAQELGAEKLSVISGLGVRQYYLGLGFKRDGFFVSKRLGKEFKG